MELELTFNTFSLLVCIESLQGPNQALLCLAVGTVKSRDKREEDFSANMLSVSRFFSPANVLPVHKV